MILQAITMQTNVRREWIRTRLVYKVFFGKRLASFMAPL
jgi:hypothetical protein